MTGESRSVLRLALLGAAAAGTTALNTVTYLDMALRGRPSISTPEDTVQALSEVMHLPVPGAIETRSNRVQALGALTRLLAGVGIGALLGGARAAGWRLGLKAGSAAATVGALVGTNGPMTVLGVTGPRTWPASSWVADIVPHLAYGPVAAAVLDRLDPT